MERQIKFRGISERTGKFVYGIYFNADSGHTIIENGGSDASDFHFVKEETIGQFTGKMDSKRIRIFEGDKVTDGVASLYQVDYDKDNCSFFLSFNSGMDSCEMMEYSDEVLEIIGNIHTK